MAEGSIRSELHEAPQAGDLNAPLIGSSEGAMEKPPVRREPIAMEALTSALPRGAGGAFDLAGRGLDLAGLMRLDRPAPAQYVVPRTFGMSAILGIMTALAVLFGGFRIYDAHPVLYLFFGVQALVICMAQMFYGQTPRFASAASGGVVLPIFIVGWIVFWDHRVASGGLCLLITSVPLGAFLGYVTGTMAAGVFLIMDAAETYMTGEAERAKRLETPA